MHHAGRSFFSLTPQTMPDISPLLDPIIDQRLALIGVGVVGRILIQRLKTNGFPPERLIVCDADPQRGNRAQREFNLKTCPLDDLCCRADIWLITTPPAAVLSTIQSIEDHLKPGQTVISFAAGVSMAQLEDELPQNVAAVRIMPNALSLIGRGVNPVAYGRECTLETRTKVQALLNVLGESIVLEDSQMNWAVGLTGASIRWLLPVLQGMTLAGIDAGLSEADARWIAAKMMSGVAALALDTEMSFEEMKALTSVQVTDEEEIIELFQEAARRAKEFADELEKSLQQQRQISS